MKTRPRLPWNCVSMHLHRIPEKVCRDPDISFGGHGIQSWASVHNKGNLGPRQVFGGLRDEFAVPEFFLR